MLKKSLASILKKHLKPVRKSYLYAAIFIAATAYISVKIPEFISRAVNGGLSEGSSLPFIVIGLGALQMIVRTLSRMFVFNPAREMEASLKNEVFSKILRAPTLWLQSRQTGDLQSLVNSDTGHIRVFVGLGGLQVASFATLAVFAISKMISIHSGLAAVSLAPLILAIPALRFGMPKIMKLNTDQQKVTGELTSKITETFVNVHIIQTTASEKTFLKRVEEKSDQLRIINFAILKIRLMVFPILPLLSGISSFLILLYGGFEAISGRLTAGDLVAFNAYVALLGFPLGIIGVVLAMWQRANAASERIAVALETPSEAGLSVLLPLKNPVLQIRHLTFSYNDQELIKDLNLEVEPGEVVGLAGPIGTGKSTLLALATALITPPENSIFISGMDIRAYRPGELRSIIGLVPQTPQLFSVTVRENLICGEDIKEELIWDCLDKACVSDDVKALPQGLDTPIGEKGIRLSGGQKQRLALARQLLRNTPIILLDDVVSAVDQITEEKILNGLRKTGRAVLLVTHRESALNRCDRVIRIGTKP